MIRLREEFLDHPKFSDLSPDAIVLWLGALGYCRLHQTDGWVPERVAIKLARGTKKPALVLGELTVPPRSSPHLRPLLERCEGGFRMVGYLDHNESKEELDENRRGKAQAGALGGRASGEARAKQSASPDRSSRALPIRSDPDHTDPIHSGDAPVGAQLTLIPDVTDGKIRKPARTPKGDRPDIDPSTLTPEEHAAYEALRDDPTLGPITLRPAEGARDLAKRFPSLDLAAAIIEVGATMRSKNLTKYRAGVAVLLNWLKDSRCVRQPGARPSEPRAPEPEDTETREQRLEKARAYGRRIIERPEGTGAGW